MSINQLIDDGAVIGYRPTLEYIKYQDLKNTEDEKSSSTTGSENITYSESVNSFNNNLPSTMLSNIDYVTQNMRLLIDKLASSFKDGDWNQYGEISSLLSAIENDNKEYIQNFIEYHKDKIKGNIIPELIGVIYNTEQRLKVLSDVLKELYYGQSTLTTEETKEIDKAYSEKIKSYETNNEKQKINYLTLTYDSILNRSVKMYAFSANKQAINIADVLIASDNSSIDSSKVSLIQKMFEETNNELNCRKSAYNEQQSVEIMQKTLYNYYNKRQELMDLYELFNQNKDSVFISKHIQVCKNQLDDAITNINRSFVGHQFFLSEIAKIERDKYFLKNIYANFNYNAEI